MKRGEDILYCACRSHCSAGLRLCLPVAQALQETESLGSELETLKKQIVVERADLQAEVERREARLGQVEGELRSAQEELAGRDLLIKAKDQVRERWTERYGWADGQTDRQTNRWTDRCTNSCITCRCMDGWMDRERWTDR